MFHSKLFEKLKSHSLIFLLTFALICSWPLGGWASELPFERALKHFTPQNLDSELDVIIAFINQSCARDLSKIRANLKPLYTDTCMLPKLISKFRSMMVQLTNDEISGVQSIDMSKLSMSRKFKYLKSLSWQQASFTNGNSVDFVTHTLIYQLCILKSFRSFLILVDTWNAKQKNSNFQLYVYPKLVAYLDSNTLLGMSLSYYNNIQCPIKDYAKPIGSQKCFRYKAQIANELYVAVEKIRPQLEQFTTGLSRFENKNNRDINRVRKMNELFDLFNHLKSDSNLYSKDFVNVTNLMPEAKTYKQVYNLLEAAVAFKITLSDKDLLDFYLAVSAILELKSLNDSIWSIRSYRESKVNGSPQLNLTNLFEIEFNHNLSLALNYLEAQDADL